MLVHPQWRADNFALGCQRAQWAPEPRFAAYVAPRLPLTVPAQIEDEYSSSSCGSSPEHSGSEGGESETECLCEWRGCGRRVAGVARLSAHVSREHAHAQHDGLFYCGWRDCSRPHRGFNARYKMLVHVRTHTNEKPHTCPQCQKCFSRAENLKIHMRSHSGEKPYACPFEGCSKAYSNSSDRFKHTRTHAVDKPYCCKLAGCDKRYTDPSSLRKHVKTYKHFAPTAGIPRPRSPARERASPLSLSLSLSLSPDGIPASPLTETIHERRPKPVSGMAFAPTSIAPERIIIRPVTNEIIRVPTYSMQYLACSRMYGMEYGCQFSEGFERRSYNLLGEKALYEGAENYDHRSITQMTKSRFDEGAGSPELDLPLNLKCSSSACRGEEPILRVRSIEDSMEFQLVRAMETPLDLSNKN